MHIKVWSNTTILKELNKFEEGSKDTQIYAWSIGNPQYNFNN